MFKGFVGKMLNLFLRIATSIHQTNISCIVTEVILLIVGIFSVPNVVGERKIELV